MDILKYKKKSETTDFYGPKMIKKIQDYYQDFLNIQQYIDKYKEKILLKFATHISLPLNNNNQVVAKKKN